MDYSSQVNLFHSLFVGPLLVWTGYKLSNTMELHTLEKIVLLLTGIAVIVYHGYQAWQKQHSSVTQDYGFQVNLAHLFFIGPLIAWTGWKSYKGKTVTDLEKTTLLFLGIAALLYHVYNFFQKYKNDNAN